MMKIYCRPFNNKEKKEGPEEEEKNKTRKRIEKYL